MSCQNDLPSCRDVVARASTWLDGELPDGERSGIERHLSLCGDCGAFVQQLRVTVALLGELPPREDLTPEAERSLLDAFREFRRLEDGA